MTYKGNNFMWFKLTVVRLIKANNYFFLPFFSGGGAAPMSYGGSQARGCMGATSAILHHSHCHLGSESH